MKRKDFIKAAALSGTWLAAAGSDAYASDRSLPAALTAAELQEFLTSLVPLKHDTVDKIITGNPQTFIKKIGT